jgi:crotonobetainyl-CoA:carnitine CoA-transferase CaiB-like acyl-CoA transferase
MTFDGPPLRMSQGQKAGTDGAPLLGQHNDYIYRQLLGIKKKEIDRLIADRVIY